MTVFKSGRIWINLAGERGILYNGGMKLKYFLIDHEVYGLSIDSCVEGNESAAEARPGFHRWLTEEDIKNARLVKPDNWDEMIAASNAHIAKCQLMMDDSYSPHDWN